MKLTLSSVLRAGKALALLGLVFLLGSHAPAAARTNPGEAGDDDWGLVRSPALCFVPSSLEFSMGSFRPIDSDLHETYGSIPTLGLRGKVLIRPHTELMLGIAYSHDRGDPYYSEVFQSGTSARISLVPIELGLCLQLADSGPRPEFIGFIVRATRIWERNPAFRANAEEAVPELVGWRPGYRFFVAHEWSLQENDLSLGLELSLGNQRYFAGRDWSWDNQGYESGSATVYQWSLGFYVATNSGQAKQESQR